MKSAPMILLVEDSEDDSYFFQRALQRSGHACAFAHVSDGGAAVDTLRKALANETKLPDLIFLDLKMPVMNGFEVLEWIRGQGNKWSVPVIVLSGSDQQSDRLRARALGASDFLVKPITAAALAERLRELNPIQESLPS